jgi:hypothetical protein
MDLEPFDPLVPALVVFVVGALAGHVLFVRLWPRSRQFWRRADYVAIVIGGAALVSVSADIRKDSATRMIEFAEDRVEQERRDMRWAIDLSQSFLYCTPPFQGSDPEIDAEYLAVCEWGQEAIAVLDNLGGEIDVGAGEYVPLDPDDFPEAPALASESGGSGWELGRQIAQYNEAIDDMDELRDDADDSSVEELLRYVAPLLIAAGMAIEITKVSASTRAEQAGHAPPGR